MSRLLVVDPGLRLFGSERALLASLPLLAEAHETVTVAIPHGAELGPAAASLGLRVIEGPIGNLHKQGASARLRALLWLLAACRRHRIDHLYLNQAGLCRIGHAAARILRLRTTIHVRLLEDIPRCARLPATARAPIDLISVSHDVDTRLANARSHDTHARRALAYDPFALTPLSLGEARDPNAFACLGRIEPSKGQRELVQAAVEVAQTCPAIRVDLVGDATGHASYGADVAALAAQAAFVGLLGYQPDAAARLSRYAFVVLPTRYETLGRVILEGWNAGCVPICSAQSGGAAEIIAAADGGILYEGFAPASLADAMRRALALTTSERQGMVERGRGWMRANVSLAAYQTALAGVLFPLQPQSADHQEASRNAA